MRAFFLTNILEHAGIWYMRRSSVTATQDQENYFQDLWQCCQASCTSQRNQKSKLMESVSTIHLYTSTPPLTCDGRRESQHVDTDIRRESQHVDTNGRRESQHVGTKGGNSNFTINCENQDSNSRPWALIPCQASCTSQRNQKSELMERASTIHLYTSISVSPLSRNEQI
jgi:hypothetical protein